jgi:poly(A) polymerase
LHALRRDPVLRLAAIVALHDEPDIGRLRHRLRAARYSNDAIDRVIRLVRGADVVWQHRGPWTAANVRRLAAITTAELDDALALASIRVDTIVVRRAVDEVRTREDLTALDPALDGDAVMSLLELSPGAAVGEALAYLRELRIEEGVLSAEDARARLEAWWREKN